MEDTYPAGQGWLPPGRPALYDFLSGNLSRSSGRLEPHGQVLPDEPAQLDAGANAADTAPDDDATVAQAIERGLVSIALSDSTAAKGELYPRLAGADYAYLFDDIWESLERTGIDTSPALHAFARELVRLAPDRSAVHFGLYMLARTGDDADCGDLALFGLHEAFTSAAIAAILARCPDAEVRLWEMARRASAWARVELVEQLVETESPRIKAWLLREATDDVLVDYLAYPCAVGGDLAAALAADQIDEALLAGAGRILEALVVPGGGPSVDAYADAADAIASFLRHAAAHGPRLGLAGALAALATYGAGDAATHVDATIVDRRAAAAPAQALLADSRWPALVAAGATRDETWKDAHRAARALGIDDWTAAWARLRRAPHDGSRWFEALEGADTLQTEQIVAYALEVLPLAAAGDPNAAPPAVRQATLEALTALLQALYEHPGLGVPLVLAALGSDLEPQRYRATATLAAWGAPHWTPEVQRAFLSAYAKETDLETKDFMRSVLGDGNR